VVLIVRNGAPTAGRTSIAADLRRLGDGCLVTGFDAIMGEQARPVSWPPTSYLVEAHRRAERHVNAGGHAWSDTSLLTSGAVRDAARRLGPLGALLVGAMPPLHVSESWEAARSDRPPGQAAELVLCRDTEHAAERVLGSMAERPQADSQAISKLSAGWPQAGRGSRSP
jgi:chloramphenicol 3-O-phosphotransferase